VVSIRPRGLRKERSFDARVNLYEAVRKLATKSTSREEIRDQIERSFTIKLDLKTIKGWVAGEHSPYGRVYRLPEVPTPELSYLIGVNFGDTSRAKSSWHHNYTVRLRVTDECFATEFSRAASKVLSAKLFKVWLDKKRGLWTTEVNSMLLFRLLKRPLNKLRTYIEHCSQCASAFLRGFFDAEGGSSSGSVNCSNTNSLVLTYVKHLLHSKFSLKVRGPYKQGRPPGTRVGINGKWYKVNKQCYSLSLGRQDSKTFAVVVGFTIPRKQRGLLSR
jgi:intein-encoded DNA endonuclease-like protein